MSNKKLIDNSMEAELAFSGSNPRSCIGTDHLKEAMNSLINARIHLHNEGSEVYDCVNEDIDQALEKLNEIMKDQSK